MSPWQSPRSRAQTAGFTLVELLVVVLIIGILAAIALPRLLGQRTRAKNAAAQAAARHALLAARSYYTQNSESYVGLGPTQLQGYESSLGTSEPADGQTPGSSANPQSIWIGNGLDGTNPNTVANGDSNGGSTVVLCSVSRGDTVYCIKDTNGVASYLQVQGSSTSVSTAAAGSFTVSGWDSGATTTAPSLTRTTVGAKLHDDFSDGDYTNNPTWVSESGTQTVSGGEMFVGATDSVGYARTGSTVSNSDYLTFRENIAGSVGSPSGSIRMSLELDNSSTGGRTNMYGVEFFPFSSTSSDIFKRVSGADTTLAALGNVGISANAYYNIAVKWNGSALTVWRDTTQIGTTTDAAFSSHAALRFLQIAASTTAPGRAKVDDLCLMDSWNITVAQLPTGWQARVRDGGGTEIKKVTESSGTAMIDMTGYSAFPYADVQVLDGSGTVKATLAPSATVSGHSVTGVFGGDVYTYSS